MASQKEEDSIVGIIPNLEIFPATKRIQKKTKKMNKLQLPQYSSSLSRRISLSYSKFLLFAKKSKVKGAEKSIPFFSLPVIFLFPMMVQFEKKVHNGVHICCISLFLFENATFFLYHLLLPSTGISKRKPVHNSLATKSEEDKMQKTTT